MGRAGGKPLPEKEDVGCGASRFDQQYKKGGGGSSCVGEFLGVSMELWERITCCLPQALLA